MSEYGRSLPTASAGGPVSLADRAHICLAPQHEGSQSGIGNVGTMSGINHATKAVRGFGVDVDRHLLVLHWKAAVSRLIGRVRRKFALHTDLRLAVVRWPFP